MTNEQMVSLIILNGWLEEFLLFVWQDGGNSTDAEYSLHEYSSGEGGWPCNVEVLISTFYHNKKRT